MGKEEIWRESPVYEGDIISNTGRVAKIKNVCESSRGYLHTKVDGEKHLIHRLVAETFIRKPKKGEQVNHKDGNILNNNVENLEWCSQSENLFHARTALHKNSKRKKIVRVNNKTDKCKYYESITDAEKDNGIAEGNLRNIIRRGGVMGGYKFAYAEEVEYKDLF